MSNIVYRDNTEEILNALEKAKRRGLVAIGLAAEGHAKRATPVDTGRLRNSITYALAGEQTHVESYKARKGGKDRETYTYDGNAPGKKGEDAVYIGSNVEYAPYVELGTSKMAARPFLKPAATEHTSEYKRLYEDSMKNA